MGYFTWIVPLTLLYVGLTANAEGLNWIVGLLLATLVTFLMRPEVKPHGIDWWGRAIVSGTRFVVTLLWDLMVSSVQVAGLVINRDIRVHQGIMALPTKHPAKGITVLSAQAITLTPGELVVDIDDEGTMYVHSLNVVAAMESEPAAQAKRVAQLEALFE
ncbi:MAG TPA: Na+/H+ antiporter subunit E [Anaerolineae bacterium]|nr:Na+/H+ antiporter subunit E [Anaerolineae bacterium]